MQSPIVMRLQKALKDNLPQILSGVAVVGVVGTVVLAVKATPEAIEKIELGKDEKEVAASVAEDRSIFVRGAHEQTLTVQETIKATWRCYVPTAVCGVATVVCIVGSNTIGLRRNAALLAAYTLVDSSFREYKDKVVEVISAQKAQKIDEEIMDDHVKRDIPRSETIIVTGGGDQLCYESLTGRPFKSNAEAIRRAAQDLDARILQGDYYASLNEWFQELGLDSTSLGELMGWNLECRIKVVLSAHKTDDDRPALAVGYEKLPIYNYDKW